MIINAINAGNSIGKGMVTMNSIIAIIFSIILFAIGVFLILKKEIYSKNILGKIDKAECENFIKYSDDVKKLNPITLFNCSTINYNYTIDGENYTNETNINNSSKKYIKNDNIKLQYNPNFPSQSRIAQPKSKLMGIIMIGIALFIFLISLLQYYFVSKVRGAGSLYTAKTTYNYFTNRK